MELVAGCKTKQELQNARNLMKPLRIVAVNEQDTSCAMEQFEVFHVSHSVEMGDCFLAAISTRLKIPVYARNTRNLMVFPSVETVTFC